MKSVIRSFPMSVGTFLIGFYVGSPLSAQATQKAQMFVAGGIVIATVIATGLLCAITRSSSNQQQSGRFSRASTGRS